jgi:hypothetical protein
MINSTVKTTIVLALICSITLGFVYWRVQMHPQTKLASHAVIVADISESMSKDPVAVVGLSERALRLLGFSKGSTLTVLVTGDDKTAGEPQLLGKYPVPLSRLAFEVKGSALKKQAEILRDIRTRLEKMPLRDRSPILLGIKRGIEQLRASGCRQDSDCYLFVRTDGEELSERAVRKSLAANSNTKDFPSPMANEGIQVAFCGSAEINSSKNADNNASRTHTARSEDRLRQVWLSLFSMPDLISFEPYCPKPDEFERTAR